MQTLNTDTRLGDLRKTQHIDELLRTPHHIRDAMWQKKFLETLPMASFCCGNPQVITGPDGFPYFQLLLPKPHVPFDNYCIQQMMDAFLLKEGFGVVLNADKEQPDWVLSYGDIVNLKLFQSLLPPAQNPFVTHGRKTDELLKNRSLVYAAKPTPNIFPDYLAHVLKRLFQYNGVTTIKVAIIGLRQEPISGIELAFNITPKNFETEDHFRAVIRAIGWFLPKHYAYICLNDKDFEEEFVEL